MKAAVTGGAGFIGSHLVDALLARGDDVIVLDNLSTGRRENLAGALDAGAELCVGEVADPGFVGEAISRFGPDVVFHLAAQADVRKAVADPLFDARVNVLGTVSVLEAARAAAKAPVVFTSTGGVIYGEGEGADLPFAETSPPAPETAYGASKLAGEIYIDLFRRLHGLAGMTMRLGNVYGPRQDPHGEAGVVAIFAGRLLAEQTPVVFGDGLQTRDYVFVADVVEALIAAGSVVASSPSPPVGPLNVGTGIETSVLDLLSRMSQISGREVRPRLEPARHGELQRVSIDPAKASQTLGWQSKTTLSEGLASVLEFLR